MNEKLKNGLTMRSCSAGAEVKNFFNALFKAIKSLCKEAFEIRNVIAMTAIALVASIPLFLLMVWMTEVLTEGGTQLYPATDALQAQLLLLLDTADGFLAGYSKVAAAGIVLLALALLALYMQIIDWFAFWAKEFIGCKGKWTALKPVLIAEAEYRFAAASAFVWKAAKLALAVAVVYFVWMALTELCPA